MKTPVPPPELDGLLETFPDILGRVLNISPLVRGEYRHWDEIRHLDPPRGLTSEEWWLGIKLARSSLLKAIPLVDTSRKPFGYATPDPILRKLHEIDQSACGRIRMSDEVTNPATRDRYILDSLIEESITSSQLEGASTTVDVARQMLRSGRKPTDRSEQMIVNNFGAMQFVRKHGGEPLTPQLVLELHRVVTEDTLDEQFVHPVVRAVILHFWIGYDHPFVDGNGRTARALFYWAMITEGYWLAAYLSISRVLRNAPGQYARSFLHTETDDNDLTYFLDHQLGVIRRAIEDLQVDVDRKIQQVREVESLLQGSADLNHRQLALLSHAMRHPGARYTIRSHERSHDVAYQTARTDLLDLAERRLVRMWKRGRAYQFEAPADLRARLGKAS